ncbi:glycerophosphodiester phosphodiesterase 1 isoform X2 [Condylostylus longicornis]|uniref:glycerophosphodiester phosphodiesterase 1 isoform X2 n=1 Tax=Condylostylus longicornis TaxID=2530218 RepID=UPI00244DD79D|nr:glycerophosphodiester phosphodiesterase 1 isoform X2 [Condylostylus longicornis]
MSKESILFTAKLILIIVNTFWLICTIASAVIPWLTVLILIVCIASKFFKLKNPNEKFLISLLGGDADDNSFFYWPVANQGGSYDAPENSLVALKRCSNMGFRNVLLDAAQTSCGEILILHKNTIDKAGLKGNVFQHSLTDIKNSVQNISELHPLGSKFDAEKVLTLTDLLSYLESSNLTIFLLISDSNARMIEKLKQFINHNENFKRRIIIISKSPLAIYQLRKYNPELICGLWTEKNPTKFLLKQSSLLTSIYGAIIRNIISPVIGISLVFISKEEFNLHISELWRNVGVRPIVYKVNSPNEKRYFQLAMKTQYLTDSLRSEPQLIIKS